MKKTILFILTAFAGSLFAGCLPQQASPSVTPSAAAARASATARPSTTPQPPAPDTPTPSQTPTGTATATPVATPTALESYTPPALTFTPQITTTPDADWQLAWSDEFNQPDGSAVDPQKWSFDVGGGGWGNDELECYTDRKDNASIQNGALVIQAQPEQYQNCSFTSARLVTKGKGDWTYGRFEIRAKLPRTKGLWPAIWLLPTDNVYGDWPASGEIDIMELLGDNPYKIYGTAHYGNPHAQMGGTYDLLEQGVDVPSFADDYHIFALEWDQNELRWYLDGSEYFSTNAWFTSGPNGDFPAPFNQRFHLILNVAVGGGWPGAPNETTQWPQTMTVDYVRVYKK